MKIFILAVLIILIIPFQKSMAQVRKVQTSAVLNHIAVYVADLKQATDFYESVFNLKKLDEPFKDGKHTWFTLGTAGQLHIIQGAKGKVEHDKNEHICFSVASIDDFVKMLNEKNIYYENWAGAAKSVTLRVDGVKQVYFQDPDGHWLEANDDKLNR